MTTERRRPHAKPLYLDNRMEMRSGTINTVYAMPHAMQPPPLMDYSIPPPPPPPQPMYLPYPQMPAENQQFIPHNMYHQNSIHGGQPQPQYVYPPQTYQPHPDMMHHPQQPMGFNTPSFDNQLNLMNGNQAMQQVPVVQQYGTPYNGPVVYIPPAPVHHHQMPNVHHMQPNHLIQTNANIPANVVHIVPQGANDSVSSSNAQAPPNPPTSTSFIPNSDAHISPETETTSERRATPTIDSVENGDAVPVSMAMMRDYVSKARKSRAVELAKICEQWKSEENFKADDRTTAMLYSLFKNRQNTLDLHAYEMSKFLDINIHNPTKEKAVQFDLKEMASKTIQTDGITSVSQESQTMTQKVLNQNIQTDKFGSDKTSQTVKPETNDMAVEAGCKVFAERFAQTLKIEKSEMGTCTDKMINKRTTTVDLATSTKNQPSISPPIPELQTTTKRKNFTKRIKGNKANARSLADLLESSRDMKIVLADGKNGKKSAFLDCAILSNPPMSDKKLIDMLVACSISTEKTKKTAAGEESSSSSFSHEEIVEENDDDDVSFVTNETVETPMDECQNIETVEEEIETVEIDIEEDDDVSVDEHDDEKNEPELAKL